jgi:hypothetical protein
MSTLPPDDFLTRAEAALRQTPVPSGPPPETLDRTLAALQAAMDSRQSFRLLAWRRVRQVARVAVVLSIVGGLVGLAFLLRSAPPLAFAEVAQKFRGTLAYQMTVQAPTLKQSMTMQVFLKEPTWMRVESSLGPVSVGYPEQDQYKILTLEPKTRTAVLMVKKKNKAQFSEEPDPMQLVERLRGLADKEAQPAGTKQFGDVQARGFRVQEGGVEWLIWANPKTRLPIQVELKLRDDVRNTLSEFRFNPPLDDALFSLEVPKGYKLVPVEIEDLTPEETLVRMLRLFANKAAGSFPKKLDDPMTLIKHFSESPGANAKGKPSPEDMRRSVNLVRAVMFVTKLKSDYGYKPDGARLGDADRILFWYRPAGASKYRALYADMHWEELTTDQLPEKPKP